MADERKPDCDLCDDTGARTKDRSSEPCTCPRGLGAAPVTAEAEPDTLEACCFVCAEAVTTNFEPVCEPCAKVVAFPRPGGETLGKLLHEVADARDGLGLDEQERWWDLLDRWTGDIIEIMEAASRLAAPTEDGDILGMARAWENVYALCDEAGLHDVSLIGKTGLERVMAFLRQRLADHPSKDGPGEPVAWVEVTASKQDVGSRRKVEGVMLECVQGIPPGKYGLYRTPPKTDAPKDGERIEGWAWIIGRNPEESGVKFCAQSERPGWAPPGRYQPATLIIHGTPTERDES